MSENINKNKLSIVKHNFDKITSQHSTSWKLVIFWILFFELISLLIEFLYVDTSSKFSIHITHTLFTELFVASIVSIFVWFCIYNIIYENKNNIFRLAIFSMIGFYFIITNDFTLQFLIQNLNPFHFFDFGIIFFVELFFKMLILYLFYQLIISLQYKIKIED